MRFSRVLVVIAVGLTGAGLLGAPVSAQEATVLASRCLVVTAQPIDWCEELAVAAHALRAGLSFIDAGGTDVPGSSSTLGTKLGSVPRFSASLRPTLGRFKSPRVTGSVRSDVDEQTLWVPGVQGTIVLSVANGFSVLPTVGGILALDLVGSASYLKLPGPEFDGNTGSIGIGARLGLLRESFTMPGLSVSIMHRALGEARYGDSMAGDDAEIEFSLSTTSARAVIGKDLMVMGFFAGVGWDWLRGNMRITAPRSGGGDTPAKDGFVDKRTVYFGGTSWSFLILQASVEVGWSSGFGDLPDRTGRFDPSSRPLFASVALRVTL